MLDRTAFAKELRALADRFNRQVSDEMTRRYYEDLQELETTEFLKAARVIYRHDTFWPAPARFLEVAGVDPKSRAETAWELALEEASQGKGLPYSSYEPAHGYALRAVGGVGQIGVTNTERLPFVKREFVQAFTAFAERDGKLPELDKPDVLELPGDFVRKAMS